MTFTVRVTYTSTSYIWGKPHHVRSTVKSVSLLAWHSLHKLWLSTDKSTSKAIHGIDTQAWPTKTGLWTIVHGIESWIWATESGTWTIVHGIETRLWTTESGPWTIVHGIDTRAWPLKSGPWTIVHGIDTRAWSTKSGYQKLNTGNGKWNMDCSPWK